MRYGVLLLVTIVLGLSALLCRPGSASATQEIFTDVTAQAGVQWRHINGESTERYLIEAMGGGVAFLDFNHDGLPDLFFVNGGITPKSSIATRPRNALYQN